MKALTLWQPWASAIPAGLKKIETRCWGTRYRGRIAIHAAAKTPMREMRYFESIDLYDAAAFAQIGIATIDQLPRASIVAYADLYACVQMDDALLKIEPEGSPARAWGVWSLGRYAWYLRNVEVIPEPILVPKGWHRGLWEWKKDPVLS